MSRIVITTWGSHGDLNPYLALGAGLRARGHDVVLCMPEFYAGIIRAEGLGFAPAAPDADPDLDRDLVVQCMHPRRGAETIFRDVLIPALPDAHARLMAAVQGADLLVSHPAALAAPIVAEQTGIRWISTVLAPLNFMSAYDPILPPMTPWLRHLPWAWHVRLADWVAAGGRQVASRWMEPVQAFRASLGLGRSDNPMFDGQHAPAGVLALYSRVFGGPYPDYPPNVTITGQLPYDAHYGQVLDPAVAAFLREGPAPIVFTLGSAAVQLDGTFWDESAAAVSRLGARAILLAGKATERLTGMLPPTVLAVDGAPHTLLFPHAAAVVHACGIGTTGTALRAGRPMLAVPHANDQPDNAWRLTRLGLARTVYPGSYKAARVARELEQLLADPRYAARAGEVAAQVAQDPGLPLACDVIEAALRTPV